MAGGSFTITEPTVTSITLNDNGTATVTYSLNGQSSSAVLPFSWDAVPEFEAVVATNAPS